MSELVEAPYELACQIWADQRRNTWTWYADRHATHWAATPYQHNGEQVVMLLDDDMRHATRSSVEATYGPLVEVPHCTECGDYFWYRNGVCRTLTCTQA